MASSASSLGYTRFDDLDPRTRGISRYATGSTFTLMTVAFALLAMSLASVAYSAAPSPGATWLGVAALAMVGLAAIPVPGPAAWRWQGAVHQAAGLLYFVSVAVGAVLTSGPHDGIETAAAWCVGASVVLFLVSMTGMPGLFGVRGWLQRACFAAVAAWLIIVAVGTSPAG